MIKRLFTTASPMGSLSHEIKLYPETGSLYIDLSSNPSKESLEVSEGIVIDFFDIKPPQLTWAFGATKEIGEEPK
jgi:hypothetical protein